MSSVNTTFGSLNGSAVPVVVGATKPKTAGSSYKTTEAQLEVWLSSQQSTDANCAYNEISSLLIQGDLDQDRLKNAIEPLRRMYGSIAAGDFSPSKLDLVRQDWIGQAKTFAAEMRA